MAPKSRAKAPKPAAQTQIEHRREISAGGIVWRRRTKTRALEIVMVKPAGKDAWTLPKGLVAKDESLIEAAARETREETGLEVVPGERVGDISYVYSWHDTPGGPLIRIFKRVYYFLMEPTGGDLSAHDEEIDEARWLGIDEALERASYKSDREIIAKARNALGE